MSSVPSPVVGLLQDFESVAVARVGRDGRLLDASPAFQILLGAADAPPSTDISQCFQDPAFSALSAMAVDGDGYRGPMRIGGPGGAARTVHAAVSLDGEALLVFAEVADWVDLMEEMTTLRACLAGKDGEFARAQREIGRRETVIQALMPVDPLTGLANRRSLEERLEMEVERASRYGTALGLVVADLDHLSEVNRRCGREAGDAAVRALSRLLRAGTRLSDQCARLDGGRFAVVLPNARAQGAVAFAERVRAEAGVTAPQGLEQPVTASLGAVGFAPGDTAGTLIERAEQALARAKHAGGNRVMS